MCLPVIDREGFGKAFVVLARACGWRQPEDLSLWWSQLGESIGPGIEVSVAFPRLGRNWGRPGVGWVELADWAAWNCHEPFAKGFGTEEPDFGRWCHAMPRWALEEIHF